MAGTAWAARPLPKVAIDIEGGGWEGPCNLGLGNGGGDPNWILVQVDVDGGGGLTATGGGGGVFALKLLMLGSSRSCQSTRAYRI